jgi:hypothetical protein
MGRVEDYLGDRLRGREIPADLRRLVELELDGRLQEPDSPTPFGEIHVLAPGELHGLEDPQYRRADDDAATTANWQAMDGVLGYAAVVVDGFNGDLFGYWLHPDEPPTDSPAILKLSTEGEFDTPEGATIVEAMVWDWLGYDAEEDDLARIVEFCDRHGLPLAARSRDDLRRPDPAVDPALLHDRLYKQNQRFTSRPAWADAAAAEEGAAFVGLRTTDPPLLALLQRLGYPDPAATVAELDEGIGEVRLKSPVSNVDLRLYQDPDGSWWLFSIRFRAATPERPADLPLPYGFSLGDSRAVTRERFGPPAGTAMVPADRWQFGQVTAYVMFDGDEGLPKYVEFWPADVNRR